MGSTVFRNPRALSSVLAALGTLQPRDLGFINTVDPLDTVSNCYNCYHTNNVHIHVNICREHVSLETYEDSECISLIT